MDAPRENAAALAGARGAETCADTTAENRTGARGKAQRKCDRQPPAYQTYAADDLASASYYKLTLAERGLYDSMLRACWVDGAVPRAADDLALAIRRPLDEVAEHLTGRVLDRFFADTAGLLKCEELDRQRERLHARRDAQQRAAEVTNANRHGDRDGRRDGKRDGKRDGDRNGDRDASEQNRAEPKAVPDEAKQKDVSRVRTRGNGSGGVAS